MNLVYGSTNDVLHPQVRRVCKLVIAADGSGECTGTVHARTDAPGVNALAVTITELHGAIDDPVAVSILRFGEKNPGGGNQTGPPSVYTSKGRTRPPPSPGRLAGPDDAVQLVGAAARQDASRERRLWSPDGGLHSRLR